MFTSEGGTEDNTGNEVNTISMKKKKKQRK